MGHKSTHQWFITRWADLPSTQPAFKPTKIPILLACYLGLIRLFFSDVRTVKDTIKGYTRSSQLIIEL